MRTTSANVSFLLKVPLYMNGQIINFKYKKYDLYPRHDLIGEVYMQQLSVIS